MNLKEIHSVYLLGIGGIGMSALARYFKQKGAQVSGYDKTPSSITEVLELEGIPVSFEDRTDVIPKADLFIYTPAIPKNHSAFQFVIGGGNKWYKRSEVLQFITDQTRTVAVAGTHGKTTTTAILAHLLHASGESVSAFVGGVMTNYNSNLITCENPKITVVEADEYDRSFLRLSPEVAVITSLDPDHLDIYGTFESMKDDYRTFASRANVLIVHESIADQFEHPYKLVYGFGSGLNYRIEDLKVMEGKFCFSLNRIAYKLQLAGKHNVENASAALACCDVLKAETSGLLASFKGVKRRFERVYESPTKVVVDDYAHHPKEIEAAIVAARMLFPNRSLAVVFQPHLFSRTRDLEDEFAQSLSLADEVVLIPIYPAREEPIEGVTSDNLLNKVELKTKQLVQKTDLVNAVLSLSAEIILMLGAGDIDRLVQPLVNELTRTYNVE